MEKLIQTTIGEILNLDLALAALMKEQHTSANSFRLVYLFKRLKPELESAVQARTEVFLKYGKQVGQQIIALPENQDALAEELSVLVKTPVEFTSILLPYEMFSKRTENISPDVLLAIFPYIEEPKDAQ